MLQFEITLSRFCVLMSAVYKTLIAGTFGEFLPGDPGGAGGSDVKCCICSEALLLGGPPFAAGFVGHLNERSGEELLLVLGLPPLKVHPEHNTVAVLELPITSKAAAYARE